MMKESYKILLLIIQQILIMKTLWRFIENDTKLPPDNLLRSRKNLLNSL